MNDVASETEETAAGHTETPQKKRRSMGGAGAFTATLVALIAIGGVLYLYQQQMFLKRDVQALQQGLGKLLSVVEQNRNDVIERLKTVPEHNHPQLSTRLQQAEQLLTDTRMRIGQDRHAWALAEAEYLVRIADHDLRFKHNAVTASAALQTARSRLEAEDRQTFSDPIRRIDSDINALSLVQLPDREALAQELTGLVERIEALPLLRQETVTKPADSGNESATEERSGWDKVWFDLGNLITIRHEDKVVAKPMLPPEQRYFLRHNLQLKLESARLALLLDNTSAWKASLDEASKWTRHYFDGNETAVKESLAALEKLAAIQLLPPLPDLGTTRALLQKLARQAAGASNPPPSAIVETKPATTRPAPAKPKPVPKPAVKQAPPAVTKQVPAASAPEATQDQSATSDTPVPKPEGGDQ